MNDEHDQPPYQTTRRQYNVPRVERGTRYYSDRVIAPLAAWVHAHRGALAEVVRRVYSQTGRRAHYYTIHRILHPDPEKRQEPSYGMGTVIVRVIRRMKKEYQSGIAPPYTTGPIVFEPEPQTEAEVSGNQKSEPEQSQIPSGFAKFYLRR